MIHTLHGPPQPRRRIAVVQIPRAQQSRLGMIRAINWTAGPNTTSLNSWTPVQDLMPVLTRNSSSTTPEQWQAFILQAQAQSRQQTPGTLEYTPAPAIPSGSTIEAPWASWQTSACNPDAGSLTSMGVPSPASAAAAAVPVTSGYETNGTPWVVIAGFLGAAASLVYLRDAAKRRGGS